ncbi:hypothetical protein LWI29_015417 [Acer saccharum]|uniref:Uncharacterized protein n=1 Tax=Acer saccharum TaxID=4024 RepID=A0AA39SY31_ACESA|nr:hypothetical protein LWI29_015417 [Acer saccharum]
MAAEESDPDDDVVTAELLGSMDVSLHSLMGLTSSTTMKLKGQLGSRDVVVLVDSGASHSFISAKVVDELGLVCEETNRYRIQVGNGMCFKQAGVCKAVELYLQGHTVVDDFFPFELGSVNVVLGIIWLCTLGVVQVDWSAFTMRFKVGDLWVCLVGDLSLCHSPITFKALARSFQIEKYGVILELCSITTSERLLNPTYLRWITKLLGFDFEIQYKSGATNRVDDALSRRGADSNLSLSVFSVAHFVDTAALQKEQLANPVLGTIIRNIRGGRMV